MRFCLIAYLQKPLIIAQSAVSRGTRCLEVDCSLFMRRAKALAMSFVHVGSSEPSPHAAVIHKYSPSR